LILNTGNHTSGNPVDGNVIVGDTSNFSFFGPFSIGDKGQVGGDEFFLGKVHELVSFHFVRSITLTIVSIDEFKVISVNGKSVGFHHLGFVHLVVLLFPLEERGKVISLQTSLKGTLNSLGLSIEEVDGSGEDSSH